MAKSARRSGVKKAQGGALSGASVQAGSVPVLDASLEEVMKHATSLQGVGDLDAAERLYEQILAKQPDHYIALNNYGVMKDQVSPGAGEAWLRRSLSANAGYVDAWNNLARCLIRQGLVEEGMKCLTQAIRLKPSHTTAWANLIEAAERTGKTDAVSRLLEETAGKAGGEVLALGVALAEGLMKLGKVSESLALVDVLVASLPPSAALQLKRGEMLIDLQRWNEAAAAYQEVLRTDPTNAVACRNRAVSLVKAGNLAEAEEAARQLLSRFPDDAESWNVLGTVLMESGQEEASLSYFDEALKRDPSNITYLFNKGLVAYNRQDYEQAVRLFREVLAAVPDHPAALNNLGSALDNLGQREEAAQVLEAALRHHPEDLLILNTLGLLYTRLERYEDAERLLNKAIQLKPDFVEAWSNLGKVFMDSRDYNKAQTIFQRAIEVNPEYAIGKYNLGLSLNQLGRLEQAVGVLRAAKALRPEFAPLRHNLGLIELTLGDFEAGFEDYRWRYARQELEGAGENWVPQNQPLPESFNGDWAYLVGEQGIGDELFFLRFAPLLKQRNARIVYRTTKEKFLPIVRRVEGLDEIISPSQEVAGGVSYHCLIGDLPYLCGVKSAADIPPPVHLIPDPDRIANFYLQWLEPLPPPYIGINWRAGTSRQEDKVQPGKGEASYQKLYKEITLSDLVDMFRGIKATLVVLQRNPHPDELAYLSANLACPLLDCSDLNDDLPEMLALLDLLDDMVGVSNTNYHMRVGLGKGGRVLVPKVPDFRWMQHGSESPWFPGMKVYRETFDAGWQPALTELRADLEAAIKPYDVLHGDSNEH